MIKKTIILVGLITLSVSLLFSAPILPSDFEKVSKENINYLKLMKQDAELYINEDIKEYTEFYDTFVIIKEHILKQQNDKAVSVIDKYIIKHKNVFKEDHYIRDYMKYGYVSYLLLIKGLLLYETNSTAGNKLIYLNYYILNKYKFPQNNKFVNSKNKKISTIATKYFEELLTKGSLINFLKELLTPIGFVGDKSLYYNPADDVLSREYNMEKDEKFMLQDDTQHMIIDSFNYDYMIKEDPDIFIFENLRSLKGIESVFTLQIVNDKTGKVFLDNLKKKAKLNIKTTTKFLHKGYKHAPYNFALFMNCDTKLGKRLLRKYVLNLR